MWAAQRVIRVSQATGRFVVPTRTNKVGRPRVRISFPEKMAHGFALLIGILATPAYIAVNIKNYRE